jgi:hypothetical protein
LKPNARRSRKYVATKLSAPVATAHAWYASSLAMPMTRNGKYSGAAPSMFSFHTMWPVVGKK